jgi:tRNA A-37 threonylcarbamoyl transferase component Bud32
VMEKVSGTLKTLVGTTPMNRRSARAIARTLVEMAEKACAHGLTHADLRLDNIAYNTTRGGIKLLFIDFGLTVGRCADVRVDFVALITTTFEIQSPAFARRTLTWMREALVAELHTREPRVTLPDFGDQHAWTVLYITIRNANRIHGLALAPLRTS